MNTENNQNRIEYIDFLKFIGLISIVIAHVGSPNKLMMIRNFDVPLMVILSSLLVGISFNKYTHGVIGTLRFYWERVKRLVFPTWIFLLVYFCYQYFVNHQIYNKDFYLYSFGLTMYGIGYVWAILVYLYSSLWVPIFKKVPLSPAVLPVIACIYYLYDFLYSHQIGLSSKLFYSTFDLLIPYGILSFLGYNYPKFSSKVRHYIMLGALAVFTSYAIYYWKITGAFQSTQICKYPPRLYYLSYGIFVAFFALMFCEHVPLKLYRLRFIRFISSHSLWIYLWHILFLDLYDAMHLPEIWYVKLLLVILSSVLTTYVINKLLDVVFKGKNNSLIKCFRG